MNTQTNDSLGFIDFHCHIIPDVDDGSKSISQSIEMANTAIQQGFSKIIATPHFSPAYDSVDKLAKINQNYEKLVQTLESNNIQIFIEKGFEIYLTKNLLYKKDFHQYCLGKTNYMLAEVNLSSSMSWLPELAHELSIQNINLILAHPERYENLFKKSSLISELKNAGIQFQVDLASIFGSYGKKIEKNTKFLLKNKLVDFFSSDAHHPSSKGFQYHQGIKKLKKYYTDQELQYILISKPNSIF